MTIGIIGATGQTGAHTIDALLARGVTPGEILALGRNRERLAELAERGFRTATIDLADEAATTAALADVDTLLLISIGAPGDGLAPRTTAVTAAKNAGVSHLVYTSALDAQGTTFVLAAEHKATEHIITDSGIPATFLRNGWFTENLRQDFDTARGHGVIANSVGDGRLATASRLDFAEATAVVLTTDGHEGKAYELSGDVAWNYEEFAAHAQSVLGTPVVYQALTPEAEREMLVGAGLDEVTAGFIGAMNAGMRDNTQSATTGELSRLIGRPTTALIDSLAAWK